MISKIRGELTRKEIDRAEISTSGGVSYELQIPSTVFESLPRVGEKVELHTALISREDALELYGFQNELERALFTRLCSASGVGPKLALTMLSSMNVARLIEAIRNRDLGQLQTVSGVGRKKAERIALELADKLEDMAAVAVQKEPADALVEAAVSALVALGYSRSEAEVAVRKVTKNRDGAGAEVEVVVREALTAL